MAPRRGGGSGTYGSSSSCPDPFSGNYGTPIAYFVSYCIFFLVTLFTIVGLARVRKRHPNAKTLLGPIYALSLILGLLYYALSIIATMLLECGTTTTYAYYNFQIALAIFGRLACFLLLVVFFWSVNSLLRQHLGNNPPFLKCIYAGVLGLIGVLTCAVIGVQSYNYQSITEPDAYKRVLIEAQERLSLAHDILYLMTVGAGGALSLVTIVALRAARLATSDLIGWVVGLIFSMFVWSLFPVISSASSLQNNYLGLAVYEAFEYIGDFFQALSWIILLFIAKSNCFKVGGLPSTDPEVYDAPAYTPVPDVPQQQTQQYYYQDQPAYNGPASNGQMAHVR